MGRRGTAARIALPAVIVAVATGLGACASRGEPDQPDRFTSTPSACQLVGPQKARQLTGALHGKPRVQPTETRSTCQWPAPPARVRGRPAPPPPPRTLSVAVTLHNAPVGQDDVRGTDLAKQDYDKQHRHDRAGARAGLRGVADQAYGQFTDRGGHVVLRDGNVLVTIDRTSAAPQRDVRAQLVGAAKEVAANLER